MNRTARASNELKLMEQLISHEDKAERPNSGRFRSATRILPRYSPPTLGSVGSVEPTKTMYQLKP